jgi:hypothetical protein
MRSLIFHSNMSASNTPTGKGAGTVNARDAEFMFRVVQNMEGRPVVSLRSLRSRMFKYFDCFNCLFAHHTLATSIIDARAHNRFRLIGFLLFSIHLIFRSRSMIHSLADSATRAGELGEGGYCLEL